MKVLGPCDYVHLGPVLPMSQLWPVIVEPPAETSLPTQNTGATLPLISPTPETWVMGWRKAFHIW